MWIKSRPLPGGPRGYELGTMNWGGALLDDGGAVCEVGLVEVEDGMMVGEEGGGAGSSAEVMMLRAMCICSRGSM